jgi:hypothetical protein
MEEQGLLPKQALQGRRPHPAVVLGSESPARMTDSESDVGQLSLVMAADGDSPALILASFGRSKKIARGCVDFYV